MMMKFKQYVPINFEIFPTFPTISPSNNHLNWYHHCRVNPICDSRPTILDGSTTICAFWWLNHHLCWLNHPHLVMMSSGPTARSNVLANGPGRKRGETWRNVAKRCETWRYVAKSEGNGDVMGKSWWVHGNVMISRGIPCWFHGRIDRKLTNFTWLPSGYD